MRNILFLSLFILFLSSCGHYRTTIPYDYKLESVLSKYKNRPIRVDFKTNYYQNNLSFDVGQHLLNHNYKVIYTSKKEVSEGEMILEGNAINYFRFEKCLKDAEPNCYRRQSNITIILSEGKDGTVVYSKALNLNQDVWSAYKTDIDEYKSEFYQKIVSGITDIIAKETHLVNVPFVTDEEIPKLNEIRKRYTRDTLNATLKELKDLEKGASPKLKEALIINQASLHYISGNKKMAKKLINSTSSQYYQEYYNGLVYAMSIY